MKSEIITGRNAVVGASANLTVSKGDVCAIKATVKVGSGVYEMDDPQNIVQDVIYVGVYVGDADLPFGQDGPFQVAGEVEAAVGGGAIGDYAMVDLTTDLLQFIEFTGGTSGDAIDAGDAELYIQRGRGLILTTPASG